MRLFEIDHEAVRNDLPAALERATADVPILERGLADAKSLLADAESKRNAAQKAFQDLNARASALLDRVKATKLRAMQAVDDEAAAWKEYDKLRTQRWRALETFQYFSLYTLPDAEIALLEAQINEREAHANLLEGKAVRARIGAVVASMGASEWDPGAGHSFEGSWSAVTLEEVARIKSEMADLSRQLSDLRKRTQSHRDLSPKLIQE